MYEAAPDLISLRQGDVIKGIYFPRYSFPTLSVLHKLDDAGELKFEKRVVVGAIQDFAVIISQCCEFNEGKRNSFSLASLRRAKDILKLGVCRWGFNLAQLVPAKWTNTAIDRLRAANKLDESPENAAVNVYLYESDGSVLSEPYVVDFTQVISVRIQDQKAVLRSKALQLDNEHRLEFQLKLAYFYGRPAD